MYICIYVCINTYMGSLRLARDPRWPNGEDGAQVRSGRAGLSFLIVMIVVVVVAAMLVVLLTVTTMFKNMITIMMHVVIAIILQGL